MKLHVIIVVVGFVGSLASFFNIVLIMMRVDAQNLGAERSVTEIYGGGMLSLLLFLIMLALGYIWSDIKDLHDKVESIASSKHE